MLLSVVILLAAALVGVRLFGVEIYTVLSGSMEPVYKTGSVIYVIGADRDTLQVGDVITYRMSGDVIATHRIVEVTEQEGEYWYRTKGDANEIVDGKPVSESQIVGTPVFTVPYLGYLVEYMQSISGRYVMLAIAIFLLIFNILPDVIFGKAEANKKEFT